MGRLKYEYHPHRSMWGVWDEHGQFYDDYPTKEEERKKVYELNGWKL